MRSAARFKRSSQSDYNSWDGVGQLAGPHRHRLGLQQRRTTEQRAGRPEPQLELRHQQLGPAGAKARSGRTAAGADQHRVWARSPGPAQPAAGALPSAGQPGIRVPAHAQRASAGGHAAVRQRALRHSYRSPGHAPTTAGRARPGGVAVADQRVWTGQAGQQRHIPVGPAQRSGIATAQPIRLRAQVSGAAGR